MKLFANKKLFKKIVILLVVITLVNALIPLHMVSADADSDFGGSLFRPIFKFLAGIGDLLVKGLQKMFIGDGDIKSNDREYYGGGYYIRYSPGVIFSNKVPGLDANFISPKSSTELKLIEPKKSISEPKKGLALVQNTYKDTGLSVDINGILKGQLPKTNLYCQEVASSELDQYSFCFIWESENGVTYKAYSDTNWDRSVNKNDNTSVVITLPSLRDESFKVDFDAAELHKFFVNVDWTIEKESYSTGIVRESTAAQLQATVSKWYKALRLVSLVALLSVLVYVGIRIIISSTGQEKAKYKKMIWDWVVAICILFILNYIMAFTMDIVNKIIEVFSSSGLVDANGVDTLMSGIRDNINDKQYSGLTSFTNLILYLVLVVYTIIFTIHYLKRVVYLAFFTMIAPLIAVTYPIDRIKDGQAQAFGTWIKEYTFNALVPVIHIIIYSALVGSAKDLATSNPLYAIVCISFLIPAEKFFKKLFGFEKASTVGQLGAAAGGALVMNAINKMGAKSGKQAAAKAGGASAPRTSGGAGYIAAPGGGAPGGGGVQAGGGAPGGGGSPSASAFGQGINTNHTAPTGAKGGNISGIKNVAGRYLNKNTAKGLGRFARRVGTGALGATIGSAIGLSTGDWFNAFKYGAIGGAATSSLGDKAVALGGDIKGSFQEGKWGTADKAAVRMFKSNGITSPDDIKKLMNIQAKTGASQSEVIAAQKIRQQAQRNNMNKQDIRASLVSSGLSNSDVDRAMNLIDQL